MPSDRIDAGVQPATTMRRRQHWHACQRWTRTSQQRPLPLTSSSKSGGVSTMPDRTHDGQGALLPAPGELTEHDHVRYNGATGQLDGVTGFGFTIFTDGLAPEGFSRRVQTDVPTCRSCETAVTLTLSSVPICTYTELQPATGLIPCALLP